MKFGKKLRAMVDISYDDWRPMFMSYKDLKQEIKRRNLADAQRRETESLQTHPRHDKSDSDHAPAEAAPPNKRPKYDSVRYTESSHAHFFTLFKQEVDKVNDFFLDKQEDYIIEHRQLSAKAQQYLVPGRATRAEVNRLRQRLINFHGQLVLLENFSTVNYTGFRKILKKHDKKTGLNVRNVYLNTVLITPVFLSETVRSLILKTEALLAEMDNIRKFRRTSPDSPLILEGPSPTSQQLTFPDPTSKQDASVPIPPHSSPSLPTYVPPRPHAFISPRSALWRLYGVARLYSNYLRDTAALMSPSKNLPAPPQALIDLVDAVSTTELGLGPEFLRAISQPSNYCIAEEDGFAMGFFVLGPTAKLQIFRSHNGGTCITRNLRGRALLQCYETIVDSSASTVLSEDGIASERNEFCIERTRSGMTNGPWPAITCQSNFRHVEWTPQTTCAIFYVFMPPLFGETMQRYEMQPIGPMRFRVVQDAGEQQFARVVC